MPPPGARRAAQLHLPGMEYYKLNRLVEDLKLPPAQHHGAGEDAAAAAHLAVRLAGIGPQDRPFRDA